MNSSLPYHLRLWNNAARLSLPLPLKLWLGLLVATVLSSVCFFGNSNAARWVLAGFAISHLLVFVLSILPTMTLRVGMVSLTHLACWTPGYLLAIAQLPSHFPTTTYEVWTVAIVVVISISFGFDVRDGSRYLRAAIQRQLPA